MEEKGIEEEVWSGSERGKRRGLGGVWLEVERVCWVCLVFLGTVLGFWGKEGKRWSVAACGIGGASRKLEFRVVFIFYFLGLGER